MQQCDRLLKQNSISWLNTSQAKRFENLSYLVGAVLFLAFLKFPVIRIQPGFRRVGTSAVLAFPFSYYLLNLSERLKVKKCISHHNIVKFVYRKHIAMNGLHPRVTIWWS
jgi:hypothetical protein